MSFPTKYRIAEISIAKTEEGFEYWINYTGKHADQGGITFRWGSAGFQSLEDAMSVLQADLTANMSDIQKQVTKRDNNGSAS